MEKSDVVGKYLGLRGQSLAQRVPNDVGDAGTSGSGTQRH